VEIAQVISLSPVRHRDDVLADESLLPVLPALRDLLPAGGLRRGSVVTSGDWGLLCLALAAGASADGAWCALVGVPSVGVRAAADVGLDPGRLLLIPEPGRGWPQVVASLLDGFDIVLLRLRGFRPSGPGVSPGNTVSPGLGLRGFRGSSPGNTVDPGLGQPDPPSAQLRHKLEAAARRYGSVLLVAGDWPGAQARLAVTEAQWTGIGAGHGRLRARRARVVASGRGAGERPRSAWLWLPGPDGAVTAAGDDVAGFASVHDDYPLAAEKLLSSG
jgi:hypothetical protein